MYDRVPITYLDLENLKENTKQEICIFGAGKIGKTWGYDLIKAFGFQVNFYCDNKMPVGSVIRDNIKVVDIQYLYNNNKTLVFLAMDFKYQQTVVRQFEEHKIYNFIIVDNVLLSEILESIELSNNESVKLKYSTIYDDVEFLKRKFKYKVGYTLNIQSPKTFNEKMQWLKVYYHNPYYIKLVDKYAVKEYAEKKIGSEYIIPTIGVWSNFDEINFDSLPSEFVLKCTHDSGSVVIVDKNNQFDKNIIEEKLTRALKINYFWLGREWPYKHVKRRIIAEKYISKPAEMIDYKFLCFNGQVKTIFTCTDRFSDSGLRVTFFNRKWERLPFERHYPASKELIEQPEHLQLMIELSEKLSEEIPFVRVDFYEIKHRVYFGEMTFFPGGGMEEFMPQKWDDILGSWINLPQKI